MGLYYDNRSPLKKAREERKTTRHVKHDLVHKYSYDLKFAVEEGKGSEMWWNPNATGGPLARVISPFDPLKVLFLRVVNHTKHDVEPIPGKITITAQLEPKDFSRRPDNQPMPRNLPEKGIDGIAFLCQTQPIVETPDSEPGSDPDDVLAGTSTDQPVNKTLTTDGGGMVKINKFGAHIVGANGKGFHMGSKGIYVSKPMDSPHMMSNGMLVDSSVKGNLGIPETIVSIPAWEKWPHLERIITWANIAGYAFQCVSKIYRSKEALDEAQEAS